MGEIMPSRWRRTTPARRRWPSMAACRRSPKRKNYLILVARQLLEAKKAEAAKQKTIAAGQTRPQAETKLAGPNHIQEVVEADGSVRYVSTP